VFEVADQRIVGARHSRLTLARPGTPQRTTFAAMLFGHADTLPPRIRAAFRPDVNEWNGVESLQLVVVHWQPAAT